MLFFFFPAVSSRRQEVKAKCSLTCEYLTEEDYTDLLWTTLSEFPGKGSEKHQVFLGMAQGVGLGSGSTSGTGMSVLLLPTALRAPCCSCGFSLPWDHSRKKKISDLLWNGSSVCSNPATLQEEENQLKGAETVEFLSISDFPAVFSKDDGYSESMENLFPESVSISPDPVIFRQFQQISIIQFQ